MALAARVWELLIQIKLQNNKKYDEWPDEYDVEINVEDVK